MIVELIWIGVLIYLLAGCLFLFPFMIKGINAIDEGAHGGSWGFKLIISPGTIVLWPFLLKKWMRAVKERSNSHE